jgi:hypothetical protein
MGVWMDGRMDGETLIYLSQESMIRVLEYNTYDDAPLIPVFFSVCSP